MFYENGYETISGAQLDELLENGCCEEAVPLKFLRMRQGGLVMVGERSGLDQAMDYITSKLETLNGGSREFALHFMCEDMFKVRIVKVRLCG